MKGGITSGVLYPAAVQEIGKNFYLVGIGGTSAGAIASCVAAAAEYRRRQTGKADGFDKLAIVADDLSQEDALVSLFRPDNSTRKDFSRLLKIIEGRAGFFTYLGMYLGRKKLFKRLVANGYGVCTGMANGNVDSNRPALTLWLSKLIDEIAGKVDEPLTFRDLHEAKIPSAIADLLKGKEGRSIDLRAVTTSISFERPFELPFDTRIFYFDPGEWRRLFPDYVVDFIVKKAEALPNADTYKSEGKLPLPNSDLPVIVAARMSLSFPILFSMVPLWAVDYHDEKEPLRKNWFSDGGITSNFPIHRFDALLPRWPTLGLNLQTTDESGKPKRRRLRHPDTTDMVYLPKDRGGGVLDLWQLFDREREKPSKLLGADGAKLFGFLGGIFNSAQSWHDNAFLKLPGYRDRLAEIWLTPDEGGMNLNMSPDTIKCLVARGREAGKQLVERFANLESGDPMSWNGHRWTRFRSGMAGLMEYSLAFENSSEIPSPGAKPLADLLAGIEEPPAYKLQDEQRQAVEKTTKELLGVLKDAELASTVCRDPDDKSTGPYCDGPRPFVNIGSRAKL
ncbi:patatin-like phospholipase family protein [Lentisalinibacter salinarum]|uniref:patatin-like phospholipase family protein n=1 Tax=Lentisalinibacter salinarum TaxID=2992239 RepID=UPI0038689E7D